MRITIEGAEIRSEAIDRLNVEMEGLMATLVLAARIAADLARDLRLVSDSGDCGRLLEDHASKAEQLHALLGFPEDAAAP